MIRVVTALSGLVLVVLALRLAMAPLFPLDKFVGPAIASFEAETGAAVKAGGAEIELFPTPRIVATTVSIDLPDDVGSLEADRLVLSLRPLPLLSGSADLAGVTVERPTVRLALEGGDLEPAKVIGVLAELARRASTQHLLAADGRVSLSVGGTRSDLEDLAVSGTHTGEGDRLVIKATSQGTPLTLTVDSGMAGAASLSLATGLANLSLDGGLAGGAFAGHFDLSVPDVAALGGRVAGASGSVLLKGAITLSAGRAELVDATATAFGTDGRLSVALDLSAARPSVDLHADLGRLPVDSLATFAALGARLGFAPVSGKAPFDAGVDLRVAEVTLAGGSLRKVHVTVVDRERRFGALADATAGDGRLSGRLDLVPEGDGRRLGASFAARDVAVGDIAALVGQAAPLTGRITADLHLSARGRSTEELAATLAADGAGRLVDGQVERLPVAGTILLPKLEGVSADLLLVGLDKPARLSGQAKSPAGLLSFEATAPPRRLLDGGAVPIVIRLDGPNFAAGFDGGVDPVARAANGSLTLASRRLPALLGMAGVPEGASLDGQLEAGPSRLTLSDTRLMVGESAFGGLLDLVTVGERGRLTGRLSGGRVDVAALAGAVTNSLAGIGESPVTALDSDLRIEAGGISAGPVASAGGPVNVRVDSVGAEIVLPRLSLGGGSGAATLTVKSGERPVLGIKGKIEGARLASLAPLVGTAADGELSLAADLWLKGGEADDLLESITGTADFSVSRGVLHGVDPMALLGRLARSVQTGFGSDRGRVGFDRLSGHLLFANAMATSEDLVFSAGDLQLTGSGRFSLPTATLDLRIKPKLKLYPDFEAPVAVIGPLASPRLYPDLPGLMGDPAAGYARLAAMRGGFARLVGGETAPKLETIGPDALTTIIDRVAEEPKPVEPPKVSVEAPAVVAPLPLARPAGLASAPRREPATARSPVLAGGPLDLGALGRAPGSAVSASAPASACRPGRDGRCIP